MAINSEELSGPCTDRKFHRGLTRRLWWPNLGTEKKTKQKKKNKTNKKAIFSYTRHVWIVPFSCFISIFIPQRRRRRARNSFGNPKKVSYSFCSFHPCVSPFFLMRNDQVYKSNSLWAVHRSFFPPLLFARTRDRHADSSDIQLGKEKKKNISNRVKGQQPFRNGLLHHQTFFFLIRPLVLEDK